MSFGAVYSRSAIDRAGVTLREFWMGDDAPITDKTIAAFDAMIAFRETFQDPLRKTVTGLRSMVNSEVPELKTSGARRRAAVLLSPVRYDELMNALEEAEDVAAFDAAMSEDGASIPWDQVKADLGWT